MADFDYDRLSEALADAITRSGRSQDADIEAKRIIKAGEALDKLTKSLKETSTAGKLVERLLKGQAADYNSLQYAIKDLEEQIEATKNTGEEDFLRKKRDDLRSDQYRQNRDAAMSNAILGFARMSKEVGNSVASATGGFVKGVQSGQSSFTLSAGLMSGAVDVANQGVQAAAGGLQGVGQIAAGSTNPKLRGLGIAAQVAGVALGFIGNSSSRLAKFGIEVLSKELEKTVAAFQRTSASGALFADGVQGMRNAAGDAGLNVDQFSNVVSANSTTIAGAGLSVTDGVKRIGGALRSGGAAMKQELLNLGYGFEEQASLVADTMQRMKGAGGPLKATDAEVAESTKRYAENLRTIAAISGEDAKKKSEQVRQQATQLAFAQKLAKLEPEQRAATLRAMENMSEQERKNFMDRVVFNGNVINKTGAIMESMSSGLKNAGDDYYQTYQRGKLDEITTREISARNAEQQRKDYAGATEIGIAGFANVGGAAQAVAEEMGRELEFRRTWTAEAIRSGAAQATAQKTTTNELTKELHEAAQAAQDLTLALQKALDPLIKSYATVTAKMLEEINTTFRQMQAEIKNTKLGADGKPVESTWEKTKRVGGAALSGATTAATIAAPLAAVASSTVIGAIPSLIGAAAVTAGGALMGGITEWLKDKEGKAQGGVARGPTSGFIEKLHGTEAVVPLPDGKSIPVNIQTPLAMAMSPEEPKPVPATVAVPKEPEPQPVPAVNVTLAVPAAPPAPPVDVTLAMPKEAPAPLPPAPVMSAVPKEPPVVPATPAVVKEPEPVFAKQKLELTGIENIENMARSFVERPTDRLDAGFTQFLSELKMTLDTTNASQAKQPDVPVTAPMAEATVLKETIEKTNAVLSDLMREHSNLMRESLAKFNDLVSVSSDNKNINQQMLNNSY